MIFIDGEAFENILDYMINNRVLYPVEEIFLTLKEKDEAEKYNFQGIYNFSLIYYNRRINYEFVFEEIEESDEGVYFSLAPILLPDTEIFKYIFPNNTEELYAKLDISYIPFRKSDYVTDKYELVNFNRLIRQIYTSDLYVVEEGINYKVNETTVLEDGNEIIGHAIPIMWLDSYGIDLEIIKNDGYLGNYEVVITLNTGEQLVESYSICNIDDEYIYLKDRKIPLRNRRNMPRYITNLDDSDGVMVVWHDFIHRYVPFND